MDYFWSSFEKRAMAVAKAVKAVIPGVTKGITRRGAPIEGVERVVSRSGGRLKSTVPPQSKSFPGTSPLPGTTPVAPQPAVKKPDLLGKREARKIQATAKVKDPASQGGLGGFVKKNPVLTASALAGAGGMYLGSQSNSGTSYY